MCIRDRLSVDQPTSRGVKREFALAEAEQALYKTHPPAEGSREDVVVEVGQSIVYTNPSSEVSREDAVVEVGQTLCAQIHLQRCRERMLW